MNRQQEKRLNDLEKHFTPLKQNLVLVKKSAEETLEEAFKRSGKPGAIEDYNTPVLCVIPVQA